MRAAGWMLPALTLVLAATLAASALSCTHETEESGGIGVTVTVPPQAEFVESVGGDRVGVTIMVPAGADPHTYAATPGQLAALSRSRMYAKVGTPVEFELAYMDKIVAVNKAMLVVDCSRGVELGASEDPDEPGMDPHIWTSAANARIMVENICDGLVQIDPASRVYYEQNRDSYLQRLDALYSETRDKLADVRERAFIVLHPAWGYFARDYDLEQIPIEVEGKEPSVQDISRIIEAAEERNIKVVFASPQFNPQMAQVIAHEIGGTVLFIDPLARDYIDNMHAVANELAQAME